LRKEHGLRVSGNRALRRLYGFKRDEVRGEWRNYIIKSFTIFANPVLFV
jgi:hypothetical protein